MSYGRSCVAASHIAICPTSRASSDRTVGSSSMPSTEISTRRVELLRGQPAALGRRARRPARRGARPSGSAGPSQSPSVCAGTRRPPGGLKCTWLGASSRKPVGPARHRDGGRPEGPRERAGERLVAGVAGLDRDAQHVVVGGDQPVRRPLQQHAAPQSRRAARPPRRRPAGRSGTGTGAPATPAAARRCRWSSSVSASTATNRAKVSAAVEVMAAILPSPRRVSA